MRSEAGLVGEGAPLGREAWTGLLGASARRLAAVVAAAESMGATGSGATVVVGEASRQSSGRVANDEAAEANGEAAAVDEATGEAEATFKEAEAALFGLVLPEVARATSWRNQVYNASQQGVYSSAEMCEEAAYFESWIQGFRRRRLATLFGAEEEVLYCNDDAHSQQNRCLVSGEQLRDPLGADALTSGSAHGSATASTSASPARSPAAFLALLERQLRKHEAALPVDLRVRGLVSARYEHDGSKLE